MLILIGDVHGEFKELAAKLVMTRVQKSSFIQVGDFGVGFKKREIELDELGALNNILQTSRNHLYVIRGNHDNPSYFKKDSGFSNITFLKDYSVLELEGKTILLVGGAISVDRTQRVLNVSYWEHEAFVYDVKLLGKKINDLRKIDLVITHNAPNEFWPSELGELVILFSRVDHPLLWELKTERYRINQLMDFLVHKNLKPTYWYYGHFHASYSGKYKGIKFRALDCSEFFEHPDAYKAEM